MYFASECIIESMQKRLMNYLLETLALSLGGMFHSLFYPPFFFANLLSIKRYGSLRDPPFQHKSFYL